MENNIKETRAQSLIKQFEELNTTFKSSRVSNISESVVNKSNKSKFDKFKKSFDGSRSAKSRLNTNLSNFKKFFEERSDREIDESPRFDEAEKFDTKKLKSVSKTGNHELLTLGNDLYYKDRKQPNTYSLIYSSKSGSDTKAKANQLKDFLKKNPNGANYLKARSTQTVTVNKANDSKDRRTSKNSKNSKGQKGSNDLFKGVGSKVKNKGKMLQLLKKA